MRKEDEEFTSFITQFETYCFVRMAEGLRNAGTTFVIMNSTVLKSQIGKNLLAYVDDIVVKSKKRQDYIQDLQETFTNLRKGNLKLNLEKCTFGVQISFYIQHSRPTKILSLKFIFIFVQNRLAFTFRKISIQI
jgi:hypothetical protein